MTRGSVLKAARLSPASGTLSLKRRGPAMPPQIRIRSADLTDAEGVFQLAESMMHDPSARDPAQEGGFLVSGYSRRQYEEFVTQLDHFYVATRVSTEAVVGFVVAYSNQEAYKGDWTTSLLLHIHRGPFMVIKQVAVAQDERGSGIASALYDHILNQANGRPVFAAVVTDPPNDASNRLHLRMGFEPLFEATPPDETPRRVWRSAVGDDDYLRVKLVRAEL